MAVGLGSDAGHRLGVGGGRRPRGRLAPDPGDRRAGARGGAVPAVAAARPARRPAAPRRAARPRGNRRTAWSVTASSTVPARCATWSAPPMRRRWRRPCWTAHPGGWDGARPPARSGKGRLARAAARGAVPRRDRAAPTSATSPSTTCAACSSISRPPGSIPRATASSWSPCAIPTGATELLEAHGDGDAAEADLIRRLVAHVQRGRSRRDREPQPARLRPAVPRSPRARARRAAGARAGSGRRDCGSARARRGDSAAATTRAAACASSRPGRELIDTLDAVLRYDFADARAAGPRAQGGRAAPRHRRAGSRAHPRRSDLRGLSRAIPSACAATRRADVEEVAGAGAHARRRGVRAGADGAAPLRAARRRRARRPA